MRRSPPRGAWIEITTLFTMTISCNSVAPPRGERGLKWKRLIEELAAVERRSPPRGAWIEINVSFIFHHYFLPSLPPAGSVD